MLMKNQHDKSSDLPIEIFGRIQKIFKDKNWPIEDSFEISVFDDFCNMLSTLTPEERNLLLNLTENFLWVQDWEYATYFIKSFDLFISNFKFDDCKNICICPLLPEADFGKPKSSISLLYLIKAHLPSIRRRYPNFNISFKDSPENVNIGAIKTTCVLCLIDDFIGTGETAFSAVEYFLNKGVPSTQIAVVSLVSMQEGVSELQRKSCTPYVSTICDKGISCSGRDIKQEQEIMSSLESKIKVDNDFKFGYGSSEALVKMMRTPNNTFPIYWLKCKTNAYAPFPR